MRDANNKQSVKCQYGHQWTAGQTESTINCVKCGALPKAREMEKAEAIVRLREWVKPGDTLHTQLKSVSRSGMSRVIQVIKIECGGKEPDLSYLGYNIALALGWGYDRNREGVKVGGCGMDAGFEVVHNLGYVLFPEGFVCTGEGCPSNDHSNGDRDYTPHLHSSGGYAFKQRWL